MAHELTIAYTWHDDGIHLDCPDCDNLDIRLDFNPTIQQAVDAQREHLLDIARTGKPRTDHLWVDPDDGPVLSQRAAMDADRV